MASFNKVILLGNLTRDPETRQTPGGMLICKLGLAVNRRYTTKEGEQREEVTFVDVDAFGRQAEVISRYLGKGNPIFIEGRLRLDSWETQNGEKRSKLNVVLENFQFVGGRSDGEGGGDESTEEVPQRNSGGHQASPAPDIDEDVPF